jgi:PAS domain S-box-containing protein
MPSLDSLKLSQKGYILIGVPLFFETVFLIVLLSLIASANKTAMREQHSKDLIAEAERVHILFVDAATNLMDCALRSDDHDVSRFNEISAALSQQIDLLGTLTEDNKNQHEIAERIQKVSRRGLELLEESKTSLLENQTNKISLVSLIPTSRRQFHLVSNELMPEVQRLVKVAQKEIEDQGPEAAVRSSRLVNYWVAIGFVLNLLLAVALALFFNRTATKRIGTLLANTRLIANEKPLLSPLRGRDEFAELDSKFHEMAQAISESMNKERALTENAVDVICSLDQSLNFVKVNPASHKLWGYQPEKLIGRSIETVLSADSSKAAMSAVREIINTQTTGSMECQIQRRDGALADSAWSVAWSSSQKALFCVAHDTTERKELERLKQSFYDMVSHDLRSPLGSISYASEMLVDGVYGPLPQKVEKPIQTIGRNAARLINLINDLLDIQKMESGRMELHKEDVPLSEIIQQSADSLKSLCEKAQVTIETQPTNLDVYADGDRLVQVLVNLLGNAIKFSPKDSTIRITVAEPKGFVEVRVSDSGPGIPEQHRQAIFERFKQLPSGKSKDTSGLGLAICKAIIEEHGGSIGVESEEGKGSTFWFRIPSPEVLVEGDAVRAHSA